MDVETLLLKRIVTQQAWEGNPDGNTEWEVKGYKNYIPPLGEIVIVKEGAMYPGSPRRVFVGDGKTSLGTSDDSIDDNLLISYEVLMWELDYYISKNLMPQLQPKPIGTSSVSGSSTRFAKEDHTHSLTSSTVTNIVGANKLRKITYGTKIPSDKDGAEGDIYIQY